MHPSLLSFNTYNARVGRERERKRRIYKDGTVSHTPRACIHMRMYSYMYIHPPPTLLPLIGLFCHINRSLLCFTYIQRWDRKAHTSWYKNFAATDCDSSKVSSKVTHLVVQNTSSDRLRQTRIALRQMFAEIFDQMNGCTCFKVRREMRLFIYICFWFVCV